MLEALTGALSTLLSPTFMAFLFFGITLGLVIGVIPGIGGVTGLALLLPVAHQLELWAAIPMLIGMLAVINTSDTIPAVLIGTPGSVGCQATIVDGYPMAKKGEAGRALGAAFTVSLIGGVIGAVVLTLSVPVMKPMVLGFSGPEFLAMSLLGIAMVSVLSGKYPLRGIIAAGLGLMIAMIGQDPILAVARWYVGIPYLIDRINVSPMALGLFAIPEIIELCMKGTQIAQQRTEKTKGKIDGLKESFKHLPLVGTSSAIGALIGFMPGLGTAIANWMAYCWAVFVCKDKSQLGKGDIRGVIAPEAANNATTGGALIPTLAFGVPGSTSMALLLAAFWIIGVPPGPKLLTEHLDIVYVIVWTLAIANIAGTIVCFLLADQIASLTRVPMRILAPLVLVLIFAGAMLTTLHIGDVVVLLGFGLLGWIMKQLDWSRPAFVLGFVLSPIIEKYYFQSTMIYGTTWLTRPTVITIIVIAIIALYLGIRIQRQMAGSQGVAA